MYVSKYTLLCIYTPCSVKSLKGNKFCHKVHNIYKHVLLQHVSKFHALRVFAQNNWISFYFNKMLIVCIRNLYFRIHAFHKTYLVAICFTCAIIRSSRKSYGNVFVHVFNSRTIFSSESCSGHKFNKPPNISCGLMYKRDDRRNENTKSLKWKMWKMKK